MAEPRPPGSGTVRKLVQFLGRAYGIVTVLVNLTCRVRSVIGEQRIAISITRRIVRYLTARFNSLGR